MTRHICLLSIGVLLFSRLIFSSHYQMKMCDVGFTFLLSSSEHLTEKHTKEHIYFSRSTLFDRMEKERDSVEQFPMDYMT